VGTYGDGWQVPFFDGRGRASLPLSQVRRGDWVTGRRGAARELRSWAQVEEVVLGQGLWIRGAVDRPDGVYEDRFFVRPRDVELQAHPQDWRLPPGRVAARRPRARRTRARHHRHAGAEGGDRETATAIVRTLQEAGHEAYFVGGAVRDMLLGKTPGDYDIVTAATPEEIEALFPQTLEVGKAFAITPVVVDGEPYEVATFRTDGEYTDGRRPDSVEYASAEEDVKRRDFTINALLYDPIADEVIDYVGGAADIQAGIIRAVGDPRDRIAEDPLRALRAVRFAARFGLDPETEAAVREAAEQLDGVSLERIDAELRKTLGGDDPDAGTRIMPHMFGTEPYGDTDPSVREYYAWTRGAPMVLRKHEKRNWPALQKGLEALGTFDSVEAFNYAQRAPREMLRTIDPEGTARLESLEAQLPTPKELVERGLKGKAIQDAMDDAKRMLLR
jgi:hypothetical protein